MFYFFEKFVAFSTEWTQKLSSLKNLNGIFLFISIEKQFCSSYFSLEPKMNYAYQ